jgi:hypothetical protein
MPPPGLLDALARIAERCSTSGTPPVVARAIAGEVSCSVVVRDSEQSTIAVAARSALEERSLRARDDLDVHDLQIAGRSVGHAAFLWHDKAPEAAFLTGALTLLAATVALASEGTGADSAELGRLLRELLSAGVVDDDTIERITALEPSVTARSMLVVRAQPLTALDEHWREQLLDGIAAAATEAEARSSVLAIELPRVGISPVVVVPGDESVAARVTDQLVRRLEPQGSKLRATVGRSRPNATLADLRRARNEALLAANVALAEGHSALAFDETGAYRLLLSAMTSDIGELERFYAETVAPLAAYDRQYETELVRTVEAFLDNDGNVAGTAQALFTHRHTVRYRLERVRELAGLDVGSSEGRERLSLGLKAMRVLGIARQAVPEGSGEPQPGARLRSPAR